MWETYRKENGSFGLAEFLMNEMTVVIIRHKVGCGYRVVNYTEGGIAASYIYEEDFELAKLIGLIKAKELGWDIKSVC